MLKQLQMCAWFALSFQVNWGQWNSAFIYSKQNIILIVSDSNPEEAEAGK
jgi:hypothetical protein